MKRISKNTEETRQIAEKFLSEIEKNRSLSNSLEDSNNKLKDLCIFKSACIVCLFGDLGTGKTTFTKSVAKKLGVKKMVSSPTFLIMKKYNITGKNFKRIFHFDAYRLKDENELLNLGWKEIITDPFNLIFIEWPENVIKAIPQKHHEVLISHISGEQRLFEIKIY